MEFLVRSGGIRRFENKDGTITEEGKKRYSRSDVEKDFQESMKSNGTQSKIIENGHVLVEKANKLGKRYCSSFNNMNSLSPEAENEVWNKLHKDFGVGVADDELFNMVVEDYMDKAIMDSVPESVKRGRKEYEKFQNDYWKDVEAITKPVIDKYGESTISEIRYGIKTDTTAGWIINDLLGSELATGFPAHLSRHFDDYWVRDTKEYNSAISRLSKKFTVDKYNKRFGNG